MADNSTHGRSKSAEEPGIVSQMADRARETVAEYADEAKDLARKGYNYAVKKADKARKYTEDHIADHPWYAVGIALGTGILLGMYLKRSR